MHPGWQVDVNFAGSVQLLQQIESGAPVDIFITADQETMDRAQDHKLIEDPATRVNFTANDLLLVVPSGSTSVTTPKDLADPKVGKVALGEPRRSCRPAATPRRRCARSACGTPSRPRWCTARVRQALISVALGEVDAAAACLCHGRFDGKTTGPGNRQNGRAQIHHLSGGRGRLLLHKDADKEFVAFLTGDAGQHILNQFGFKKTRPRGGQIMLSASWGSGNDSSSPVLIFGLAACCFLMLRSVRRQQGNRGAHKESR